MPSRPDLRVIVLGTVISAAAIFLVVAPADAGTASGVSQQSKTQYVRYTNGRFGFSLIRLKYFRAEPPPADGDGLAWQTNRGRVSETGYGQNNVFGYSPQEDAAADADGVHVTYSNVSGKVVTVSGYKHHHRTIVYQRDVVGRGSIDTLYWVYPSSQRQKWATPITRTAHGFRAGDIRSAH